MHQAARTNDVEEMQKLLVSGLHDVNAKDSMQRTPLHLACWAGHAEMVKLLLRHHAKPGALAGDNFTALHFANNVEIVKMLVKKDKQLVKARVSKGNKTALHLAVPKGNLEVVACLLDAGADVAAKTGGGQTCLELAKTNDMYEFLKAKYQERIQRMQQGHEKKHGQGADMDAAGVEEGGGEDEGDGEGGQGYEAAAPSSSSSSASSSSSLSADPEANAGADTVPASAPAAAPEAVPEAESGAEGEALPSALGVRKNAPSVTAGAASKRARMKASAGSIRLAHLEEGE